MLCAVGIVFNSFGNVRRARMANCRSLATMLTSFIERDKAPWLKRTADVGQRIEMAEINFEPVINAIADRDITILQKGRRMFFL
jgi:hypothetical protein